MARATRHTIGEVQMRVAGLEDVIRSKETAGRDKDNRALPELCRLAGAAARRAHFPELPAAAVRAEPTQPSAAERIAAARERAARKRSAGPSPER